VTDGDSSGGGELWEGDVLDYRANGWVLELHKDDVVLARGL
jgi:hypothetical protein